MNRPTPPPPPPVSPKKGGGTFLKLLLLFLLLGAGAFVYAMHRFNESPRQTWDRMVAMAVNLAKRAMPSEQTPASPSEATPPSAATQASAPTPTPAGTPAVEASLSAKQFYVAPNGDDANDGSKEKPFATLEKAKDTVRQLKKESGLPSGGIIVWMREGTYPLAKTFTLGSEDSGVPGSPVVYRAYPGEKVTLTGGRPITGFVPYKDQILKTDLGPQGWAGSASAISSSMANARSSPAIPMPTPTIWWPSVGPMWTVCPHPCTRISPAKTKTP